LHADGALAEERAALEITALAKLHRMDEARAEAIHFRRVYPNSLHQDLVTRALTLEEHP
jgi:hypothetical protein